MSNFYTYTHNNHLTKKHKINGVRVVVSHVLISAPTGAWKCNLPWEIMRDRPTNRSANQPTEPQKKRIWGVIDKIHFQEQL